MCGSFGRNQKLKWPLIFGLFQKKPLTDRTQIFNIIQNNTTQNNTIKIKFNVKFRSHKKNASFRRKNNNVRRNREDYENVNEDRRASLTTPKSPVISTAVSIFRRFRVISVLIIQIICFY